MGYKLITTWDVGRTEEELVNHEPQVSGFTNSLSVLPTSQVVYQPITHRNLWYIAFI